MKTSHSFKLEKKNASCPTQNSAPTIKQNFTTSQIILVTFRDLKPTTTNYTTNWAIANLGNTKSHKRFKSIFQKEKKTTNF